VSYDFDYNIIALRYSFLRAYVLRLVPMGGGTTPLSTPLSARRRREVGEWEREGGMDPAGRERVLSPRSHPRWQACGDGRRVGARRRAGVGVRGREGWGGSDVAYFDWSTRTIR
jgi:hypothetical protein